MGSPFVPDPRTTNTGMTRAPSNPSFTDLVRPGLVPAQ